MSKINSNFVRDLMGLDDQIVDIAEKIDAIRTRYSQCGHDPGGGNEITQADLDPFEVTMAQFGNFMGMLTELDTFLDSGDPVRRRIANLMRRK